eukprot:6172711-Pleurochrysis_carterae.AAC.1
MASPSRADPSLPRISAGQQASRCLAISLSAGSGQGRNQSMAQPLTRPGYAAALARSIAGEKQRAKCRLARTRSIQNRHKSEAATSAS